MFNQQHNIGHELLDVPMGDMIQQMAFAIAEAQIKLDSNSIDVAQMMGGLKKITDDGGNVWFEDSRVFFGKERISLSNAIDQYNSSTDASLKAEIKTKIDSDVDLNVANLVAPAVLPADKAALTGTDAAKVYKTADGKYYKYINSTTGYTEYTGPFTLTKKTTAVERDIYIPSRVSMLELGFAPTFYQFIDTIIEVKISIKISQESSSTTNVSTDTKSNNMSVGVMGFPGFGGRARISRSVTTTQVNATYSQKYSYSAEGSSLLRTKLVPIPPPAILEERIRMNMELAKLEAAPAPIPVKPA